MWTLIFLATLNTAPPTVEAKTLDGEVVSGSLVEVSAERIAIDTTKGRVSLELQRLAGLSSNVPTPQIKAIPVAWIDLVDGCSLVASGYTVREGRARIELLGGPTLDVATDDVATVRLQPLTETLAAQWSPLVDNASESDVLVVGKDLSLDNHRGVLGDVSGTTVQFQLDGDLLPVKRGNVFGLIYYHPRGRELPEPICRVTDVSGSTWAVHAIKLHEENLTWTTPLGQQISRPLAAVARIDFSQGKIVYLSDLKPESVDWTPYFGSSRQLLLRSELYSPRKDIGLESKPLELDGKTYAKGLALHSRTELTYRLPGEFRWLRAQVGIDDGVRPRGNVKLVVRGDNRELLATTLAGTDASKPLNLDLQGIRRLSILVDFGEDLDVGDHLDLCDARVVK
jgi:hypothetical protein